MDEVTCQDSSRKKRDHPIKAVRARRGPFCCCKCRLSVSSSSSPESEKVENGHMSSLAAHALVQRRLDQIAAQGRRRNKQMAMPCKFIVMFAMDKESYDPKADFRRSMMEVIASNRIEEPKELRCLLNCYMSINSEECRPIILEAFHEACTSIFMCM